MMLIKINKIFMGNHSQSQSIVDGNLRFIQHKIDSNYGEVSIYQRKNTNEQLALITRSIEQNSMQLADIIDKKYQFSLSRYIQHKHLIQINSSQLQDTDVLCSRILLIKILLEYYSGNIQDEFKFRKEKDLKFSEQEIWYIIIGLADILQFLKLHGQEIVDIHPMRILLNERKQFKIMGRHLLNDDLTNIHQIRMGYRDLNYLAPEQINLYFNKVSKHQDWEKINVFNIGLLAAQMATQIPTEDLYIGFSQSFDFELLNNRLDQAFQKNGYSNYMMNSIRSLLADDQKRRPTYQQILDFNVSRESIAGSLWPELSPRPTIPLQESPISDQHVFSPQKSLAKDSNTYLPEPITFFTPQTEEKQQLQIQEYKQSDKLEEISAINSEDQELFERIQKAIQDSKQALQEYEVAGSSRLPTPRGVDLFPITSDLAEHPSVFMFDEDRIKQIIRDADSQINKITKSLKSSSQSLI